MSKLKAVWPILFGLIFILSAITKMFPIDIFSAKLLEFGISDWVVARFLSRAIISLELAIGLSCLIPNKWRSIAIWSGLGLTLVFTVVLMVQLVSVGEQANCHCFGDLIPLSTSQSIIKNVFILIIGALALRSIARLQSYRWYGWLAVLCLPIGMLTICIVSPPIDVHDHIEIGENRIDTFLPAWLRGEKMNVNVLLLSTECDHCRQVAHKLGSTYMSQDVSNENFFVILDSSDSLNADTWMNEAKLNHFQYQRVNSSAFLNLTLGSFPKMWVVENDTIRSRVQPWELMELDFGKLD